MRSFQKVPFHLRNGYKDPKRMEAIHNLSCVVCERLGKIQESSTEAHHIIGCGIGKKASDALTIALCRDHHSGKIRGVSIHSSVLKDWESEFGSQEELLQITNKKLGMTDLISVSQYRKMAKPSKYRSQKVRYTENGQEKVKDSKKEFRRSLYLKELEKLGRISNLQEQVPFVLQERICENGKVVERAIKLIADFTYTEGGDKIVEDVKSAITKKNPTYILKRKMFRAKYPDFRFREV